MVPLDPRAPKIAIDFGQCKVFFWPGFPRFRRDKWIGFFPDPKEPAAGRRKLQVVPIDAFLALSREM